MQQKQVQSLKKSLQSFWDGLIAKLKPQKRLEVKKKIQTKTRSK